ncbi:hypothetical protein GCM10009760_18500 [Kitasatospora kazusensis]|uniref:Tail assembly chaperone n=1 Tax=Kitasatospora kazusensis TaxID=407974 RepID=A0ABP5KV34_9ACTN
MKRVNLKSQAGSWVDLREPSEVPERLRRPARRLQLSLAANPAFASVIKDASAGGAPRSVEDIDENEALAMAQQMGTAAFDAMDQLNDLSVVGRVMGWSFDGPVTTEALQDLPGAVYDELRALCADGALDTGLDLRPTMDDTSPIAPSTASA